MPKDNGDPYNPTSAAYVGDGAAEAIAREEAEGEPTKQPAAEPRPRLDARRIAQIFRVEERAVRREQLREQAAVVCCAALAHELLTCPERAATPLEVADMAVEMAEALVGRLYRGQGG